jgi:hypothetical protein
VPRIDWDGVWMELHGSDPTGAGSGSPLHVIAHPSGTTVGVGDPPSPGSGTLRLVPPAPNPFEDRTALAFHLERPGRVECAIFDLNGRRVWRSAEQSVAAGRSQFVWDGRNDRGEPLGPGVYFYRLRLDGRTAGGGRVAIVR